MSIHEDSVNTGEVLPKAFEVEINPDIQGFQALEVTKVDESLPYKPALEVGVTLADGSRVELDATTPYAILRDAQGGELSVSAAAAGHVQELHISGEEAGSVFDVSSLDELMGIVAEHLPGDVAQTEGVSALSVETGRSMGQEGVAGLTELLEKQLISNEDIDGLMGAKVDIARFNFEGTPEQKEEFVELYNGSHAEGGIQLIVRGSTIVPAVNAPKQPTTELFMVFGPGKPGKTMYTMAPGRHMPQMPNASQNVEQFQESSEAWLNTVMLVGE